MTDTRAPALDWILRQIGTVGKRLSEIGAAEGAAGNISVCVRGLLELGPRFQVQEIIDLPLPAPGLSGTTLIITGSGTRLREITDAPLENLACVLVQESGRTGRLLTSSERTFARPTSELASHLGVHESQMGARDVRFHTVIHSQPLHLTYLSHIPRYQDQSYLNKRLLRWQGEALISMPEGLGVLPFLLPNSAEHLEGTVRSMQEHQLIVWSRHGVLARADDSVLHGLDLTEYAEAAARYESLNLAAGEQADGLSPEQLRGLSRLWNVRQTIF